MSLSKVDVWVRLTLLSCCGLIICHRQALNLLCSPDRPGTLSPLSQPSLPKAGVINVHQHI